MSKTPQKQKPQAPQKAKPKPKGQSQAPSRKSLIVNHNRNHSLFKVFHQIQRLTDEKKSEKKGGWSLLGNSSDAKDSVAVATVSMAQNLFSQEGTYEFVLRSPTTLNSTAAPAFLQALNWDPSICSEWSTIQSLFTEVRLIRATIHFAMLNASWPTGPTAPALYLGSSITQNSVTPASSVDVINSPDLKLYSLWYVSGETRAFSSPSRPNLNWALTTSPASQVDFGCFGQFTLVARPAGLLPVAATALMEVVQEFHIEVRARL